MQMEMCFFFILLIGVGCFVVAIIQSDNIAKAKKKAEAELAQAKWQYEQALKDLKADPTDPDVKQRALRLGRAYSEMTRAGGAVTIFDELALSNDINAASARAGASQISKVSTDVPASHVTIKERLDQLAELKDQGVISDDEYDYKRSQILDEI